jgi:hypothetical protein
MVHDVPNALGSFWPHLPCRCWSKSSIKSFYSIFSSNCHSQFSWHIMAFMFFLLLPSVRTVMYMKRDSWVLGYLLMESNRLVPLSDRATEKPKKKSPNTMGISSCYFVFLWLMLLSFGVSCRSVYRLNVSFMVWVLKEFRFCPAWLMAHFWWAIGCGGQWQTKARKSDTRRKCSSEFQLLQL